MNDRATIDWTAAEREAVADLIVNRIEAENLEGGSSRHRAAWEARQVRHEDGNLIQLDLVAIDDALADFDLWGEGYSDQDGGIRGKIASACTSPRE